MSNLLRDLRLAKLARNEHSDACRLERLKGDIDPEFALDWCTCIEDPL